MWSLIRTELTRLRWRRAVLVLLAAMVIVPVVLVAAEAYNTRPFSEAEYAEAEAQLAEEQVWAAEESEDCIADPEAWDIPTTVAEELDEDELRATCAEHMGFSSRVEDYLYRSTLSVDGVREGVGVAALTVLALVGGLIGTTFVGHDWASGSMSNQLLFESRRGRIWAAKAIAAVLGVLVVAVVALALFWTALWLLLQSRDVETAASVWRAAGWSQLRGLGLVAGATLAAYALTMWFRSTVGSLGLMFGVTLFSSLLIAALLGVGAEKWMLPTNAMAVVMDGLEYWAGEKPNCTGMEDCSRYETVTAAHGATYLGTILLLISVPSVWSFRRKDVP